MPDPTVNIPQLTITADRLGKRFGREWILEELSDTFRSGEIIGVSGRNGSGKSTLLRLVCGQLSPSRGALNWQLAGQPVDLAQWYQHVSWTGPYMEVVEELSIKEMLAFHFGMKPLRAGLSVGGLPELLGLSKAQNRALHDCSSGMRQRVLLGTALYAATPLLLLDEPTVTLDEPAREWFHAELAKAAVGRLTIIASNDAADLTSCTRIITLNSGI